MFEKNQTAQEYGSVRVGNNVPKSSHSERKPLQSAEAGLPGSPPKRLLAELPHDAQEGGHGLRTVVLGLLLDVGPDG